MPATRILILYNEPVLAPDHPDAESEHEILYTVDNVSRILVGAGFAVARLGVGRDAGTLLAGLRAPLPDMVFNLFEGTADHGDTEAYVTGVIDWLGLPFSGSPPQALWQARSKHLTKYLLEKAGLPTPRFFVVDRLPVPECALRWPVIVKPALEDASVGIDHNSVVTEQRSLADRVEDMLQRYGPPVLVEQFIRGREFHVSLIETPELRALPVSETIFGRTGSSCWPILTYNAKWMPETPEFQVVSACCPADIPPELKNRLALLACQSFKLLNCRGYGRIDFRVSASGRPYVIDVNPNSDLSPLAGLASGLEAAGLSYDGFIVDLVRSVLKRREQFSRVNSRGLQSAGIAYGCGCGETSPSPAESSTLPPAPSPVARVASRRSAPSPLQREATVCDARVIDRQRIRDVIERCESFSPEEAVFALRRLDTVLAGDNPQGYELLILMQRKQVVGYVCFGGAGVAEGVYQFHEIALLREKQGRDFGRGLLQAAEDRIGVAGGRVLLANVSSLSRHTWIRQLLQQQEFRQMGEVPDYYFGGGTRLTYAKHLTKLL